jgi:hypothetical protein
VVLATQVPVPLHREAVTWVPAVQDAAGPQAVPEGQLSQAPFRHFPSVVHELAGFAAHRPRGSVVPSVAGAHVPFAPPVNAAAQA